MYSRTAVVAAVTGPAVEGLLRSITQPSPVVAVVIEAADVVAVVTCPAVEGLLRSITRPSPVVAVVLEAADVVAVAEHLKNIQLPNTPTWLIGENIFETF